MDYSRELLIKLTLHKYMQQQGRDETILQYVYPYIVIFITAVQHDTIWLKGTLHITMYCDILQHLLS